LKRSVMAVMAEPKPKGGNLLRSRSASGNRQSSSLRGVFLSRKVANHVHSNNYGADLLSTQLFFTKICSPVVNCFVSRITQLYIKYFKLLCNVEREWLGYRQNNYIFL
jgi:hypothetical protein